MKIYNLIKYLQSFPKDMNVVINDGYGVGKHIMALERAEMDETDNELYEYGVGKHNSVDVLIITTP